VKLFSEKVVNISDAKTFKISNLKYYVGPNPYLNTGALVFDFTLLPQAQPLLIEAYHREISRHLPELKNSIFNSYGELLAETLFHFSLLDMDLHLQQVSLRHYQDFDAIALQSLHYPTSKSIVETLWRWLEMITLGENFNFLEQLTNLQQQFRNSIYGDPTVYALISTAYQLNIPSFFIWEEGLMQYGYGKYHIRGLSTIFDTDSLLDSDLTTQKDDSKDFLSHLGFPIPTGKTVYSLGDALTAAQDIGYPVAIKPVAGHEGIGVTANIRDKHNLAIAFANAQSGTNCPIVIEQSLQGSDFRLVCIGEKFVAALERRPPYVIGDGYSTLAQLIEQENQTDSRKDTPTSPLTKIIIDDILKNYIEEQGLTLDTVIAHQQIVYLRKVANISSGGVSINVTDLIHPDNQQLAEDIAQYLGLACLGIDIIAKDISQSWKQGNFGIIEINASPGVFMHLKPAQGESIDVPRKIFKFFFPPDKPSRIPIVTFNRLGKQELSYIIKYILKIYPHLLIGGICQQGVYLNERQRITKTPYNNNIKSLLRHPCLDLLIAEYPETIFQAEGLFYQGSDLVVLSDPTIKEIFLEESILEQGIIIKKISDTVIRQTTKGTENLKDGTSYLNIICQTIAELIRVNVQQ